MRINKKLKFVFVSTPKAGTHTIYKILDEHFSHGLLQAGFHNNRIVNSYQEYFRWTVVRNPFTRAASIWWSACRLAHKDQYGFRKKSKGQYNFTKFVKWMASVSNDDKHKEPMLKNQTTWLAPAQPIHIIHLEKLEEELKQLPFWKNGIKIDQLNTTTEKIEEQSKLEGSKIIRPSVRELYYENYEAIDAVLKWAEPDFNKFGYIKEVRG